MKEVSIALLEKEQKHFRLLSGMDDIEELRRERFVPYDNTVLSEVIKGKKSIYRPDILKEKTHYEVDAYLLDESTRSDFLVPLIADGKCLGTLNCTSTEVDGFTEEERQLLSLLAPRLAQAILNVELFGSLNEEEGRFRNLVEATSDWIWEVDKNAIYTYVSPKIQDILGYEPDEVLGKTPFDLMPPEEAKRIADVFGSIRDLHQPFKTLENTNLHKDGHLVVLETSGVPVFNSNGEFQGYRGIDRDITDRKRLEEALKESHDRLTMICDSLDSVVYVSDMESHKILFVNKYVKDFFGDVEGQICWQVFQKDQSGPCSFCTNDRLLDSDNNPAGAYVWEFQNTQTGCWHEIHDRAIKWVDGRIVRLEIAMDITSRKESEKKLAAYQERLRDLAYQLTLAEEKERKRLASDLHDNIGQIMVTLKMKLQELKELNTFPALEKHIDECLTLTLTALQQTRSLTFELNPPVLYQLGFIQSLKWLVSDFEKEYNITITLEDDFQPKLIDDEIRFLLFRSIRELLMNVVKHAKASNIKICTLSKNGHLQVTVADDGIGFNVSELNISNPDNTAGYGLFSIRERVLHYGGEFTIESHSDRGTHVILIIPLSGSEKTEKD